MFLRSVLLLALAAAPERLSLEEAVRRAVVRNPSSLAAQQEIARAEGILRELRSPSLPTI